jgi:hypothetical protein
LNTRVWFNGPLINNADLEKMKQRASKLILNVDCDNYSCIVKGKGKFPTVEQFINWFDIYAPLICRGITIGGSTEFTKVVNNLHAAMVFFCRPYIPGPDGDHSKETYRAALDKHAESLLNYAIFVEEKGLPDMLLRSNLH